MRYKVILVLIVCLAVSITATAVTPQFWENFTQEELLKGTLTRVSLSSDGKLFLAPPYDLLYDTGQPYVYSVARDSSGNLYVLTGHEGEAWNVDAQGKVSVYCRAKELDVLVLALNSPHV